MGFVTELSDSEKNDLVVSLAALVLADGKASLTAENLTALASGSGNKLPAAMAEVFAKVLEGRNVGKVLEKTAGKVGGGAPAAGGAAAGGAAAAAAEEEEEEEEEEEDDSYWMGRLSRRGMSEEEEEEDEEEEEEEEERDRGSRSHPHSPSEEEGAEEDERSRRFEDLLGSSTRLSLPSFPSASAMAPSDHRRAPTWDLASTLSRPMPSRQRQVVWFFSSNGGMLWMPCSAGWQTWLEDLWQSAMRQGGASGHVRNRVNGDSYTVSLNSMQQINIKTGRRRSLVRLLASRHLSDSPASLPPVSITQLRSLGQVFDRNVNEYASGGSAGGGAGARAGSHGGAATAAAAPTPTRRVVEAAVRRAPTSLREMASPHEIQRRVERMVESMMRVGRREVEEEEEEESPRGGRVRVVDVEDLEAEGVGEEEWADELEEEDGEGGLSAAVHGDSLKVVVAGRAPTQGSVSVLLPRDAEALRTVLERICDLLHGPLRRFVTGAEAVRSAPGTEAPTGVAVRSRRPLVPLEVGTLVRRTEMWPWDWRQEGGASGSARQ